MATKGSTMPTDAGDFTGEAASSDPETDKLLQQHAAENARKQKAADRKSNVSDELINRHKKIIQSKDKEIAKVAEKLSSLKGERSELLSVAKDDGVPIKALKKVLKMESQDPDEIAEEYADVAHIIRVTNSPLQQLNLFSEHAEEADRTPYAVGFDMGMEGESHDHIGDRYKAGSEEFEQASKGWHEGQAKLADKMFRSKDGNKTAGDKGTSRRGSKKGSAQVH